MKTRVPGLGGDECSGGEAQRWSRGRRGRGAWDAPGCREGLAEEVTPERGPHEEGALPHRGENSWWREVPGQVVYEDGHERGRGGGGGARSQLVGLLNLRLLLWVSWGANSQFVQKRNPGCSVETRPWAVVGQEQHIGEGRRCGGEGGVEGAGRCEDVKGTLRKPIFL